MHHPRSRIRFDDLEALFVDLLRTYPHFRTIVAFLEALGVTRKGQHHVLLLRDYLLAGDTLEKNMHIIGQLYYSGSTILCTPASRAQEVGLALGAQAGEKRLTRVLQQAGFTRIRRVAQTDTNMVIEARR